MTNEIETYIYENYITKIIRESDGVKYILRQDINSLNLNEIENQFLLSVIDKRNIQLLEKDITKEIVNIFNSSNFDSFLDSTQENDDYSALDRYLEEEFIPNNIIMGKFRKNDVLSNNHEQREYEFWGQIRSNEDTNYEKICPTIQLSKIKSLNLNEKEIEYIFSYLEKRGIVVRGKDNMMNQNFENIDSFALYRNNILPEQLSKEEMNSKFILYQTTKDPVIREQLILSNLRLVPYISWKYAYTYDKSIEEIESYGYEGLIEAVDKYNPSLGYAFSTFAINNIKWKIMSGRLELDNLRNNEWSYSYLQCKKIIEELTGKTILQDSNLAYEISELMIKESEERLKEDPNETVAIVPKKNQEERKKQIEKNAMRILLINQENIDDIFYNMEPTSALNVESITYGIDLKQQIKNILDTFSPLERNFIILRYGLNGERVHTFEEIGKILEVTKDRLRQVEAKALRKFRYPTRTKYLKEYYGNEIIDIEQLDEVATTLKH